MKKVIILLLLPMWLMATINVVTTYPYISDIVKHIGQNHVKVRALAKGYFDPHFIVPKPSLIGKIKQADILFKNGGELEIGWLPPVVDRANNSELTFVDLSLVINMIEVPKSLSREYGDIHAKGNPHFHLDPDNITLIAKEVVKHLKTLDPSHAMHFENNFQLFKSQWEKKIAQWEQDLKPLKNRSVITFHNLFSYLYKRFDIKNVINIEPLPGITPSASHIQKVIVVAKDKKPLHIISDVYHSKKIPKFISEKSDVTMVVLPHDIGALSEIEHMDQLFDYIVKALLND
jgi:zinc/manganese transport system substrate-binding protein